MYRDVWPLATFTLKPLDAAEGQVLWMKVMALTLGAVVVPLGIPRQYNPIDKKVGTWLIYSFDTPLKICVIEPYDGAKPGTDGLTDFITNLPFLKSYGLFRV